MALVQCPLCPSLSAEALLGKQRYISFCVFCRGLKVHITHCDVFAGFRKGVCARPGAEVAVKQQQLSSGVKGDKKSGLPSVFFWGWPPALCWASTEGRLRDPSEGQAVHTALSFILSTARYNFGFPPLHAEVSKKEFKADWALRIKPCHSALLWALHAPSSEQHAAFQPTLKAEAFGLMLLIFNSCLLFQPASGWHCLAPCPPPTPCQCPVFLSRSEMVEEVMQY